MTGSRLHRISRAQGSRRCGRRRARRTWLATHFSVASPVEEMVRRSGLAERTFKRRFTEATGFAPIDYVQRLGSRTPSAGWSAPTHPADEISWQVGYEDARILPAAL